VEAELLSLAETAGTRLVTALASTAWEKISEAVTGLWRSHRGDEAERVASSLADTREGILSAQGPSDLLVRRFAVDAWQARFRELLAEQPDAEAELRRLVESGFQPAAPATASAWTGDVRTDNRAWDGGTIYNVGQGTLHVTGTPPAREEASE
jgi:hypothetical protein